jgi:hydrogenase maturation protease
VLVIGLGNIFRGDDGVGQRLVEEVQRKYAWLSDHVQCVDGGTRGVALLDLLAGREVVIVLDSIPCGKDPGEVAVLDGTRMTDYHVARGAKSHEGNAAELLCAAELTGALPERVFLVTVEPAPFQDAPGLSESVLRAIPEALAEVSELVDNVLVEVLQTATA